MLERSKGIVIAALMIGLWGGGGYYAYSSWNAGVARGRDGCPKDITKIASSTILLIDRTDQLYGDGQGLTEAVGGIADALGENARLAVHVIGAKAELAAAPWKPPGGTAFSRCKTADPGQVSALTGNPRLVAKTYEQAFRGPVVAVVKAAATISAPASASPIAESLEAALWSRSWEPRIADRRNACS